MEGRNIVICCDGTNNQFGREYTNVVRLIKSLDRNSPAQILYYDPGVGTLPEPKGIVAVRKWLEKIAQLALGAGLMRNVTEAYTYLMNYVEPDHRVFLFGFSRGAYTVRVLAGMLHMLGLLPKGNENLVPYLKRLYKSIRETAPETAPKQWDLCDDFRRTFSRSTGHDRHFIVHFLGVWDTVSSVGWFWEPASFPYTRHNPSVEHIWHAVSIDERRAFFRQNLMEADSRNPTQEFHERWFPGDHSDVGGGHPDGGLWRTPFTWMLNAAKDLGLQVDEKQVSRILQGAKPPFQPWTEPHDLLKKWWKLAELLPKRQWDYKNKVSRRRCNCRHPRFIASGSLIDQSALHAVRDNNYKPRNFSDEFLRNVCTLAAVPGELEFQWTNSPNETSSSPAE